MPPARKLDRGVLMFDVASSGKEELLESLLKFHAYKNITSPYTVYNVMLVNTEGTANDDDVPNVVMLEEMDTPNLISTIRDAKGIKNGNWLRGLLLAVRSFAEEVPKGTITKQIVFYTTLKEELRDIDKTVVNKIVSTLTQFDLFLYIIGPDVTLSGGIKSMYEVRRQMIKLSVENPSESLATAIKIAQQTENTVICNVDVGFDLLRSFKHFKGSQPWKVPLTFNSGRRVWLRIPVKTCKIFARDKTLRLHNTVKQVARKVRAEDGSEVDKEDIVKGVLRHGRLVNIPDRAMFKEPNERRFEVVCITAIENVPEAYMIGDATYSTIADGANNEHFLYLLRALAEQKKLIIAERVYYANLKPKYVALIPKPHNQPPCFIMREIPYADNIKKKFIIEIPTPSGKTEQDDIKQFCSLIDTKTNKNVPMPTLGPQLSTSPFAHNLIVAHLNKRCNLSLARREVDSNPTPDVESLIARLKSQWDNGIGGDKDEKLSKTK